MANILLPLPTDRRRIVEPWYSRMHKIMEKVPLAVLPTKVSNAEEIANELYWGDYMTASEKEEEMELLQSLPLSSD